ncbi:MAG: ABC transporter substrate-binding protein [Pseudomonadota bacterium]
MGHIYIASAVESLLARLSLFCLILAAWGQALAGPAPIPVTVAMPGPGALPMLPLELMPRIGADKAEGIQLSIRYFGGGPLALKDLLGRNSDFAALGMSALAETRQIEGKAYSVASMVQVPAYTLMASNRLKDRVKSPRDLRGRTVGIHTASKAGKSTGQHVAEFILLKDGVTAKEVNFINTGQQHDSYAASLLSGVADAIIANEPAASLLEKEGIAYRLADLHDPATTRQYLGSLFLYTQLTTRQDVIQRQAGKVNRMVAALIRTLRWMQTHSPNDIVDRLGISDTKARNAMILALEKNKTMFSPDGVFSEEQLRGTATLMQRIHTLPSAPDLTGLIAPQWVGIRP